MHHGPYFAFLSFPCPFPGLRGEGPRWSREGCEVSLDSGGLSELHSGSTVKCVRMRNLAKARQQVTF